MDLKSMSTEELRKLLAAAKAELDNRQAELALYTHDCANAARHHLGKYKHWAKHVVSVDISKTNGYAFGGNFLAVEREHKLPVGSLIAEVCDTTITLYQLTGAGKIEIATGGTKHMSEIIEIAAQELAS
jgi:hypothetical protein